MNPQTKRILKIAAFVGVLVACAIVLGDKTPIGKPIAEDRVNPSKPPR